MRVFSILLVLFLVSSGCAASVKLAWDPNPATENVTGYNVYRSTSSGGGYAKLNPKPVTTPFYRDTVTYNGKTYFYVVRAVKAEEESPDSNEVAYEAIPSVL